MGCAQGASQFALLVAACSTNQLQAQVLGPLRGDEADATGNRMKQHEVAWLQPALGQDAPKEVLRGQAFEHHGCTRLEIDRIGQLAHAGGGHDARLAVRAGGVARVGGAVAGLEVHDTLAHSFDHASAFHAQEGRHGHGIKAGALVNVDVVQTDGVVADPDLAGAGLSDLHVHQFHLLGTADLAQAYRLNHVCLLK